MFCITYVTVNIQNVLFWLECSRHEDVCATGRMSANNALFHSNSHINQMPPQIIHILPFF